MCSGVTTQLEGCVLCAGFSRIAGMPHDSHSIPKACSSVTVKPFWCLPQALGSSKPGLWGGHHPWLAQHQAQSTGHEEPSLS